MRLMRVRVVSASGEAPSGWRSLLRLVGLALAVILLFTGFLPALVDGRRRALQDFMAGTTVVYDAEAVAAVSAAFEASARPGEPLGRGRRRSGACARRGQGPPVVLVHGYGVSGRYMLPLARILATCCSAFAPDLPGHGRSEQSATPLGIGGLADALGGWLDAVGLERPAFVANSMGCQIVTELAVRRPQRVGPMVLVGPTIDPRRRTARHQIFGALRDSAHEPALLVALAGREWAGRNLGQLRTLARSVLADRIEERLPAIEQPTIVVHGEKDGLVSREWAEQAAALLPRGRLVVVPGEPHAIPYTHPRLLAGIVQELIAEEARARSSRAPAEPPTSERARTATAPAATAATTAATPRRPAPAPAGRALPRPVTSAPAPRPALHGDPAPRHRRRRGRD